MKNKEIEKKNIGEKFYLYTLIYTLVFLVVFFLGYKSFLFQNGKSFFWENDGVYQHYPFLYDTAQVVKQFLANPQNGFPMWSWELGFGADIIQSYSILSLGDPLTLLTAIFVPLKNMETAYNIMIVIRFYLVGIAFLMYCKYMGKKMFPSIIGSLIYVFSAHMLYWGIRHPFFITPIILLPLLFIGVEEILKERKPYLFILLIGFSAFNSYYFLYMNTIAIFIYAMVRFFDFYQLKTYKNFISLFLKTIVYYLLGILISGILLIPSVYAFLNVNSVKNYVMRIDMFQLSYYAETLRKTFFIGFGDGTPYFTVAGIVLPCLIYLIITKGKLFQSYKKLFFIFTLFLCFPFIYAVFNGLSSPTNRWIYIYTFILSFIVVMTLDEREKIKNKDLLIIFGGTVIYYLLFSMNLEGLRTRSYLVPLICIVAFLAALFISNNSQSRISISPDKKRSFHFIWVDIVILLFLMLNLTSNIDIFMTKRNYGDEFVEYRSVEEKFNNSITKDAKRIPDNSFYRVGFNDARNNKPVVNDLKSTHVFNSMINKNNLDLFFQNNIRTTVHRAGFNGVDNISALETLLGVKYYLLYDYQVATLPYGFEKYKQEDNKTVYINKTPLPIGFVYYNTIAKKNVNQLNDVDKTQVMLDAGVVETEDNLINPIKTRNISENIQYEVVDAEGVDLDEGKVHVKKKNGTITLKIEDISNSELYFELNNIHFKEDSKKIEITVETKGVKKSKVIQSKFDTYYMGVHDILMNMGYAKTRENLIKVHFSTVGEYTYDNIKLYEVRMDNFNKKVNQLKQSPLENIVYTNNTLNGDVSLKEKGILYLSIPYSAGWHAYIDGKATDTIKVNTAFTGIVLEKGYHKVHLKYRTPLLVPSIISSLVGIGFLIAMVWKDKKRVK